MEFPSTENANLPIIIVLSFSFLCYYNSLSCGFVFDDVSAIRDNKDILPSTPVSKIFFNDFWGIPMEKEQSHKSYRPICVFSFRINYLLDDFNPFGYHLLNVLLHLLVIYLYHLTCKNYVNAKISFVASLLFAIHPIHTEAVTGAVGRAELLSSIFFLLALLSYSKACTLQNHKWFILLTAIMASCAMLSKEIGITVLGLCVVHELCIIHNFHKTIFNLVAEKELYYRIVKCRPSFNQSLVRLGGLLLTLVVLLSFRIHLLQGSSLPVFTKFDNPASLAEALPKILTYAYLPCLNLWLLLCPSNLCCDWTMGTVPLLSSLADIRVLAIIAVSIMILHLIHVIFKSCDKHAKQIIIATSWMIIPYIPASNLFFPVGFVIAERILYIPSMGFCLLVSLGFYKLYNQCKKSNVRNLFVACYLILLFAHSLKTITRNSDWHDELSIFLSGLKVNSKNAKLYNNVGHALENQKKYTDALILFKEAANVQPDDIGAHINIGRSLNALEKFNEAETAYRSAKRLLPRASPGKKLVARIAPNSLNLFLNLGNLVARNESRLEEADTLYKQAIAMRSDYIQAYINRGDVLLRMNKTEDALDIYKQALKYDNNNADIHYNLGVVALEQGNPNLGLAYLNKALEIEPSHPEALLNSAIVIQELGLNKLKPIAVERLLKLKDIQPDNEKVYFNLGMLATDEDNAFEAEVWFRQAIKLKADFRSALFNLALLLADQQRAIEALEPLLQLHHHHPTHVKGLILLGDIYTNYKRDLDKAESCYNKILQIDPFHVQGQHNLCVVHVERGDFYAGKACLEKALQLAPEEQYIKTHLNIVNSKIAKMEKNKQ